MNFEMPETQEEIPAALIRVDADIKAAKAKVDALVGMKRAIQGMCDHHSKRTYRGFDDCTTVCQICKKEPV